MAQKKNTVRPATAAPTRTAAKSAPRANTKSDAPAVPTSDALAAYAGVALKPALKAPQVQRLRRALPGYVNILDDVAELLEADDALNLRDVTAADLLRVQRQQKDLAAREAALEAVYISTYHQRLVLDDEGIGMLQKVARRVQSRAEENPDLPLRYKSLLAFLASFRGGGRPTKPAGAK